MTMPLQDIRGNPLSGANQAAGENYNRGLTELNLFVGDPVASAEAAIAAAPGFVMGHALRAWLFLLSTEAPARAQARDSLLAARDLPRTIQEAGHIAAIEHLLAGRWHGAARVLEDVAIAYPHDLLALQVGHQLDFFTGNARMLRDRIARVLPHWTVEIPGWHALLGMHAFGLEEMGDYEEAETTGRQAVRLERRDAWAHHAVAHVLEMKGRVDEGIAWMHADPDGWSRDNFFAAHNWWHLALYHLELGEIDEVLRLFDGPIYGARSQVMLDMVDAASLLWRLHLRGVDVGARFQTVADVFVSSTIAGHYAFNDLHAMMAFVGARRDDLAEQVLAEQRKAIERDDDNARFTRDVGYPIALAIQAFGSGSYHQAKELIRPVQGIANRFGGSHAQRDVITPTLIEAAIRARDHDLATALAGERIASKPSSPLGRLLAQRAAQPRAN